MRSLPQATERPAAGDLPGGARRSWLDAEMDGVPVRRWLAVGALIAATILGFGAWWTWGLDRGGAMAGGGSTGGMGAGAPATDVRLPPVEGLYAGERVLFVHPEASDPYVAGVLTGMMGGSPVLVVPELADAPDGMVADVYVFTNGVRPDGARGPFGFQPDVFGSVPGDPGYRPLRRVVQVSWRTGASPRLLTSVAEVRAAQRAGEVRLERTDVVVNMPMLVWPGGQR